MAKAARAALAVAAPEAAAASKITPGMHPAQVNDELQRRREAARAAKAARAAAPGHPMVPTSPAAPTTPPPASPGGGPSLPSLPGMPAAASTGSGFLLGVAAWGLGLAYLNYGPAGVRQFIAAKFLNRKGNLK